MGKRPYRIYPQGFASQGRATAYGSLHAATKAARRMANQLGMPIEIHLCRAGGGSKVIRRVQPSWNRDVDLRDDVDLAHGIGLEC